MLGDVFLIKDMVNKKHNALDKIVSVQYIQMQTLNCFCVSSNTVACM